MMNNQQFSNTTYEQSNFDQKPIIVEYIISDQTTGHTVEIEPDYNVNLLKTIIRARDDREMGYGSPVFSNVKDMRIWFEKQNE